MKRCGPSTVYELHRRETKVHFSQQGHVYYHSSILGFYLLRQLFSHRNWIWNLLHSIRKWKVTVEKQLVKFLLSLNKLCVNFPFIWVIFIRESDVPTHWQQPGIWWDQHWYAVNFNPTGDGKIDKDRIYLKWIQVHLKIVHYALGPCSF
jgi:hypothetical protein